MSALTVIMPVYNGEEFLKSAIDSILNQTFKDFNLVIVNDNSNDSTQHIIDEYMQQDRRIIALKNSENLGPAASRNLGIDYAKTKLIALMDADDIALPKRFEKQIKFLNEHPNIGVCGTWFTFFGDKKNIVKHSIEHENIKVSFLNTCPIGNPTVMFRKSVLKGLKFEQIYVPAEDYGLWSQVIATTKFHNIPESLLQYRWHPNNISQTKKNNLKKSEIAIRAKQLQHLHIEPTNPDLDYYLNSISLKRKQSSEEITKTIKAGKELIKNNKKTNYYNQFVFENHIKQTAIRTLRNANNYDKEYYKFVKNKSGYFEQMKYIDRVSILVKSLF
ncbi:glycosyltransferase family 2 protein [Psychroserpens sp. Hel_I_66]|uniref:glycosyltransferase family 2 protein n=1 Tax=Psychroserpens sp. Hel_I_66 TaxID=1250004 RepID=UPI000690A20C|nr:glycosyltransferase family 2 protein [Psychroserpens sp. Hel_I_66]